MIRITLRQDGTIEAAGHAGLAPAGQDMVCAAVSAVVNVTAEYLRSTDNLAQMELGPGYARLVPREMCPMVRSAGNCLQDLARQYAGIVAVDRET